jgi:hypothetical protein
LTSIGQTLTWSFMVRTVQNSGQAVSVSRVQLAIRQGLFVV